MGKWSTLLVTMEVVIKTTMKYYSPTRMTKIKKKILSVLAKMRNN